jgi:hypothetical protein
MADGGSHVFKDLDLLTRMGVKSRQVPPVGSRRMYDLGPAFARDVQVVFHWHFAHRLHLAEQALARRGMHARLAGQVRVEFADPRVEPLARRVEQLARELEELREAVRANQEKRWLWRSLKERVDAISKSSSIPPENVIAANAMIERLHYVIRDAGFECVREPQLDYEPDDAAIEIGWFDRQNGRALSIVAVMRDPESDEWATRLHELSRANATDTYNPTNSQLTEAIRRFIGG